MSSKSSVRYWWEMVTFQVYGLCLSCSTGIPHPEQFCKLIWMCKCDIYSSVKCSDGEQICFWLEVAYLGSSALIFISQGWQQNPPFCQSLKPAAELCFVQQSTLTQQRKIKKGHTHLCSLSGMSWKQAFWEHHKRFIHLSVSGCLGSLQFWHLSE